MTNILNYKKSHEPELLALLGHEPDWADFLRAESIAAFRQALLESATLVCESRGRICGYVRALVDGFGIYVSELYVAPACRGQGFGAALLGGVKQAHPGQAVYVLSDADGYYEKLGHRRVGSVFQL